MWYSPEGRLVVGESISLTEYETLQIGSYPSVVMQILAKMSANEANISDMSNELLSHAGSKVLAHPDGCVTEEKLCDQAVSTQKLASGAVTEQKIADSAVSEQKLASGAVIEQKIADNAVVEQKLASGAVTEQKIADNAVV